MDESKFLWDAMEALAREKYYIGTVDKPAFLIYQSKRNYGLYLNSVGLINSYPSLKKARDRIKSLVENANYPMMVFKGKPKASTKKPFAMNEKSSEMYLNAKEDCMVRAFNIEEWKPLVTS